MTNNVQNQVETCLKMDGAAPLTPLLKKKERENYGGNLIRKKGN